MDSPEVVELASQAGGLLARAHAAAAQDASGLQGNGTFGMSPCVIPQKNTEFHNIMQQPD